MSLLQKNKQNENSFETMKKLKPLAGKCASVRERPPLARCSIKVKAFVPF